MSVSGRDPVPPHSGPPQPSEPAKPQQFYQQEHAATGSADAPPWLSGAYPVPPLMKRFGRVGVVPWTLAQTLVGAAITLIPWMTFIVLSQATKTPQAAHPTRLPVAQDAIGGVIFLIFTAVIEGAFVLAPAYYVFSRRASDVSPRQRLYALGVRRTPLLPAISWVIVGLLIILAVGQLYGLLLQLTGLHLQTNVQTLLDEAKYAPLTVVGALIGSVFIAPFCEEIFFRGFLFGGLLRGMPFLAATLLSALIFGIAHGDVGSFFSLFAIGILLAIIRWRTGSLWPGVALHASNNALAAVALLILLR